MGGVGGEGRHLYRGGNFEPQMYVYYTNRGAHYTWPEAALPPAPPLGIILYSVLWPLVAVCPQRFPCILTLIYEFS